MRSLQQQAVKMTQDAQHNLFVNARAIPEDKQSDWTPAPEARSVLSQLQECAIVPYFFASLLTDVDPSDPAVLERRKQAEAAIVSIDTAEAIAEASHKALYDAILSVSDADLDTVCAVPWDDKATKGDIIFFSYWNLVYHVGQINYMQLILGDKQMHF